MAKKSDQPFSVLLVESTLIESSHLENTVRLACGECAIQRVQSIEDALHSLGTRHLDLILLQLETRDTDSISSLTRVMERHASGAIIILSSASSEKFVTRALRAGAQDVLIIDELSPGTLRQSISSALARHHFVAQLREATIVDELTGCYNRRGFLLLFEQEVRLVSRVQKGFSILYVDVDDLKQINDTFGHHEGDKAIQDTADLLKKTFRDADVVSRIGGDEFAVLMIDVGDSTSEGYAHRLNRNLEQMNEDRRRPYQLALSTGMTYFDPTQPCTVDFLLSQADAAMYQHKVRKKRK